MAGSPVYITANNGSPVNITGAGAGSIPISGIAAPIGSVADQPIVVGSTGNLVVGPGFFSNVLFQSYIPFIFAPTGSMANNGAITMGTALPTTYANAYVLLPAGAIASGVPAAAAWYYCTMTNSTAGTVFNNTYTSGRPSIPASPTAFVTTGPGAFTGITSAATAVSYTMPAATMGIRDTVRIAIKAQNNNSGNNKIVVVQFGGGQGYSLTNTTSVSMTLIGMVSNRDVANIQIAGVSSSSNIGASGNALNPLAIDTTGAVVINQQGTRSTATDTLVMEGFTIEILKGS